MHIHGCLTRSKEDSHPYRYMSVRNPCILVQVSYQSGNFPRGRVLITLQWELELKSGLLSPQLTGSCSRAQKDEKEMAGRESFYICKRKTVNQLWVTAWWSRTGNVISSLTATPQQKGRKWKDRESEDRRVLLTGSMIIALEMMMCDTCMHIMSA